MTKMTNWYFAFAIAWYGLAIFWFGLVVVSFEESKEFSALFCFSQFLISVLFGTTNFYKYYCEAY